MHFPKRSLSVLLALALCASGGFGSELLVPSFDYPTIQSALDAALDGDTIYIDDGTYDPTGGTSGFPEIFPLVFASNCTLTSASNDATLVTIDAGASAGVVVMTGLSAGAQIVAVTLTNGSAAGDGGGILVDGGTPTLSLVTITNCVAAGNGGGIACINGAAPTIDSCTISTNAAGVDLLISGNGGGLSCTGGSSPSVTNCSFTGNAAVLDTISLTPANGGGIYCNASTPTIDTNTISSNTADDSGGGIACEAASAAIINHNSISSNTAANSGGGILCDGSSPQITNQISLDEADAAPGTISLNTASTLNGGGIYCANGSAPLIDNNDFDSNNATADGGAIACDSSSPSVTNNTMTSNIAGGNGGGLAAANGSAPDIEDNTIGGDALATGNQAQGGSGGGIFSSDPNASPTLRNNEVRNNTSGADGGGIYCAGASLIASNTIYGNATTAGNGGGLMCVNSILAVADINHNLIYGNTANGGSGGGIAFDQALADVVSNTIAGANQALRVSPNGGIGGGIYAANGSIVTITNCILWGNTNTTVTGRELGVDTHVLPSTMTVAYSDVDGGQSAVFVGVGNTLNWFPGNIDEDPLFASATDFHEMSVGGRYAALFGLPPTNPLAWFYDGVHSPCIDAGDGSPYGNELAPNGGRINMGVYGDTNEASKSAPLIMAVVTTAPTQIKYNRTFTIKWTLIGLIKGDKITVNRVEWGTTPFSMPKVTATDKLAPFAAGLTSPSIPGVIMYYRVHAVINGVTYFSNVGQVVVNPF